MTKILVIEDEPDIRDEVIDWLQFEGYTAIGAANGRQGLEQIYLDPPDLIVSDIAMPEMDGYEVLLEVRLNPRFIQIPFIFLTAVSDRESVRKGMNMGADDFVSKPFTHAELLNSIHTRLDKKYAQEMQLQEQLERLHSDLTEEREKRLLKSRLVAMFSHDFRNPLSSILSSSSIIRNYEDRLTYERKLQYLDRIDGSVRLLMQMLEDMLMVAEMEGGHFEFKPQQFDLTALVSAIVDEFQLIDQGAHKFTFSSALQHFTFADPKLLRQIVANLLSNAIKYSAAGTEVKITLDEAEGQLSLTVEDHGIGIPADSLPLLFEPFHRAENAKTIKGMGLGLTIVKQSVDLHGGTIYVESIPGERTCFAVVLPQTVNVVASFD
jgi:two-component system, sensor histidine kinase and response regulator